VNDDGTGARSEVTIPLAPGREAASTAAQGAEWGAIVSRHRATQSLLKRLITGINQASSRQRPTPTDRQGLVRIEGVRGSNFLSVSLSFTEILEICSTVRLSEACEPGCALLPSLLSFGPA
jgi:hypothetical protein